MNQVHQFVNFFVFVFLIIASAGIPLSASSSAPEKRLVKKIESLIHHQPTVITLDDFISAGIKDINRTTIRAVLNTLEKRGKNYKDLYFGYDTTKSYCYDFNHSSASAIPIEILHGHAKLHASRIVPGATLFLKLRLKSHPLGRYFLPTVEVSTGKKQVVHTFENALNGIRYLNVSALDFRGNTPISFKGHLLDVPDQNATLYSFKPFSFENKKILIVAPHPDDAEIAAFGLYSTHPKQSYIVTITAGEAGSDEIYPDLIDDEAKAHTLKGKHRTFESVTVPLLGGMALSHSIMLGYYDLSLKDMYLYKAKEIGDRYDHTLDRRVFLRYNQTHLAQKLHRKSNWQSLVDDLEHVVRSIDPDIIVTPYPSIDLHPDHQYTTIALFQALRHMQRKKGSILFYTNHFIQSRYYPIGQRHEVMTLPPLHLPSLYFDSLVSVPLSMEVQSEKTLALEAMSDIRYTLKEMIQSNARIPYTEKSFLAPCMHDDPLICRDYSYFRKAIRSNELFYRIKMSRLYDGHIELENGEGVRLMPVHSISSVTEDTRIDNDHILMHLDKFSKKYHTVFLSGWALVPGLETAKCQYMVKLHGIQKTYRFETYRQSRFDVAKIYKSKKYIESGFLGEIDLSGIAEGNYTTSIEIIAPDGSVYEKSFAKNIIKKSE